MHEPTAVVRNDFLCFSLLAFAAQKGEKKSLVRTALRNKTTSLEVRLRGTNEEKQLRNFY